MNNTKNKQKKITNLADLCKDYVLYDDELMSNPKIKRHMNDDSFWKEMGMSLLGRLRLFLNEKDNDENEYDDFEDYSISDNKIIQFALNSKNRFEINDIILETIEEWIVLFGQNKTKR